MKRLVAFTGLSIFILSIIILSSCGSGAPSLSLDKKVYSPGEKITVSFKALEEYEGNAWVGIIPSDIEHGSESKNDSHDIAYQYLRKKTSGTLTFSAPSKPGNYDFRMHDTDSGGKEVTHVSFEVKE